MVLANDVGVTTFVADDEDKTGFFTMEVEGTLTSFVLAAVGLADIPSPIKDEDFCFGLVWTLVFSVPDL